MAQCVACDSRRRSGDGEPCGSHLLVIEVWIAERDQWEARATDLDKQMHVVINSLQSTGEAERAWRAAHDVVKSELERIKAEREQAQLRALGHVKHGEGAVSDGPGAPNYPDVRGLIDDVSSLIEKGGGRAEGFKAHR